MAAFVLLLTSACGSQAHDYIRDNYQHQSSQGDTDTYHSKDPVGTTAAAIADAKRPDAREQDGGSEYLRYNDDIVIVSAAAGGDHRLTRTNTGGFTDETIARPRPGRGAGL